LNCDRFAVKTPFLLYRLLFGHILATTVNYQQAHFLQTIMVIQLAREQKEISLCISGFPPVEIWDYVKPRLNPQTAQGIENLYLWGGRYLDCFLEKQSNPLSNSGLTEELQKYVQSKATYWLMQGNLLFQAEKHLKSEAKTRRIPYPWQSWADLNKQLIKEEFISLIAPDCSEFWESLPAKTFNESRNGVIQYFKNEIESLNNDIDKEKYRRNCDKLQEKKSKLKNSPDFDERIHQLMPWTQFCERVFKMYKKEFPGFLPWLESQNNMQLTHKFAIIGGQLKEYPGRKTKRKLS
jgi:hypothetical protein